jgi:hypothetical protein
VRELQEKNKKIITQNQEEKGETLKDNIPRDTLEEAEDKEAEGEEPKGAEEEKKLKVKKRKKIKKQQFLKTKKRN